MATRGHDGLVVALRVAVVVALASLALLGFVVIRQWTESAPFDPLGQYPPQEVMNRTAGVRGPSAHVGDDVVVTGIKCNDSDVPVTVRGSYSWVSVEPRGAVVPTGEGLTQRRPGCETFRFENPMPDEVIQRSEELLDRGITPIWYIAGFDEPIAHDGTVGVRRAWQTENFSIVADGGGGGTQ